jgi:hypothetical protein
VSFLLWIRACVCCELPLEVYCLPRASRLVIFCSFPARLAVCGLGGLTESSSLALKPLRQAHEIRRASRLGGVSIKILFAFHLGAVDVPSNLISVL